MIMSEQSAKSILRAVYLLIIVVILNMILNFYYHISSVPSKEATEVQKAYWKPRSISQDLPPGDEGELILYGHKLIIATAETIGPLAVDEELRYSGNGLDCNNCHLDAGRKIGSGPFIGVTNRYPQFRGRENRQGSIADRINGCMERSMNGKALPEDSQEMQALVAYMTWLSKNVPEEVEALYKGYTAIDLPSFKADTVIGKVLYREKCMHCHMERGKGLKKKGKSFAGYIYPPLGGNDTYNDGAGMNRVITAAEFIKSNMPFGATYDAPRVSDVEAYHIAAYINTFQRPEKTDKNSDYPDMMLKPVSTPYGPWADDFSPEQHKFGPFPPIIAFYKKTYDLEKSK